MKEYKIIQMIDINRNINAIYKPTGWRVQEIANPVLGLALVEDMEGNREIKMMILTEEGLITFLEEDNTNFIEIRKASEGIREFNPSEVFL